MKCKGFTLIELLAVILILALLALISVPIVKNIKDNSRDEVYKRNIEAYGRAAENAVSEYRLKENKKPKKFSDIKKYIKYKGDEIFCDIEYLDQEANVYLSECKIKDKEVKDEKTKTGWYNYGNVTAAMKLLVNANSSEIKNYTEGDIHQLYTFNHQKTEQTDALTDYRYIGNDPYNYVLFNNDEVWRIVGVFTVEDAAGNKEQRIKIIKQNSIGTYAYDDDTDGIKSNDWKTASLNKYLNGEYYNSLTDETKNMIAETKYYLGGKDYYENLSGPDYYEFERGKQVYENNSISWTGNIGLIYPSDFVYAYSLGVDDTIYTNGATSGTPSKGWISVCAKRLISHNAKYSDVIFLVYGTSSIGAEKWNGHYNVSFNKETHPTLYLKSDVKIISGDGSKDSPYKLSM